jgi:protein-disulfide isomerase
MPNPSTEELIMIMSTRRSSWLLGIAVVCSMAVGGFLFGSMRSEKDRDRGWSGPTRAGSSGSPGSSASSAAAMPRRVYRVEKGAGHLKGGAHPKVTLVLFSDFRCPFCKQIVGPLEKILRTYSEDVQLVWKHLAPSEPDKIAPALAAEAAAAQGKFWAMHDLLFSNREAQQRADLLGHAERLGLDVARFRADLDSATGGARIDADRREATKLGITATPTLFINGRKLEGAWSYEVYAPLVEQERRAADALLEAGVSRQQIYAHLIKDGLEGPVIVPRPQKGTAYKVDVAGAPTRGSASALVTIVQFSDFQCPFCAKVEPTLARILKAYEGKVRIVWRDFPLPNHKNAVDAAVVARVAKEHGKFWEMHERLFASTRALSRAHLLRHARELQLDLGKVEVALDRGFHRDGVQADVTSGRAVGVKGTPAFFVNGQYLSGAQPFEKLKGVVDVELRKAESLVAGGVPEAGVYDEIMKTAVASLAGDADRSQRREASAP